ncbi:MAG: hypothetical protein AAGF12_18135 [Myxococcota bacterium]
MTVRMTSGRRMFLQGAAGTCLSIPLLPSILGRGTAQAATECTRVLLSMRTGHGGAWRSEFYPASDMAPQRTALGPLPWQAQHGPLSASMNGGRRALSPVSSAPADRLTDRIIGSMNVMLGLDYAIYPGHNDGYHLGAYCADLNGYNSDNSWGPSIDQLLAYSPNFYSQRAEREPSIPIPVVNVGRSFGHVRPKDPSSPVRSQDRIDANRLWRSLFQPGGALPRNADPVTEPQQRISAFNDVHGALSRLRSRASAPGARLSSDDQQRLERHMDGIASLRGHFEAVNACAVPEPESDLSLPNEWAARAGLIRAAVECGLSQIFVLNTPTNDFLPDGIRSRYRDLHQDFVHQVENDPRPMPDDGRAWWWHQILRDVFEHSVLPMVEALDFDDANGQNVLDSSLVLWTAEAGLRTHSAFSVPVVTFGSVEGRLSTGQFIDYRSDEPSRPSASNPESRRGLVYDQLLGTILRAFGVDSSEYDHYRSRPAGARGDGAIAPEGRPVVGGYGAYSFGQVEDGSSFYHDENVRAFADEPLPVLFNG